MKSEELKTLYRLARNASVEHDRIVSSAASYEKNGHKERGLRMVMLGAQEQLYRALEMVSAPTWIDLPLIYTVINNNGQSECFASLEENARYHQKTIPGSIVVPCRLVPIQGSVVYNGNPRG